MNERQFKTAFSKQLLGKLLQKYERSQAFRTGEVSRQRPQFSLQSRVFAKDYYDEMDFRKQQWMNEVLVELEQQDIIQLQWKRFREAQEASKVYLNESAISQAYESAGIIPKTDKLDKLRCILDPLANHPLEWVRQWAEEVTSSLAERKSGGLNLGDQKGYKDLVKVLEVLPQLEDNTPKRILSQALYQDSKHFEQKVEARLVSLLKKYSGHELDRDEEYLDQVGIVQNPKLVMLCGALQFEVQGKLTDLSAFPGGVGLSVETVKQMKLLRLDVKRIVTIENLTSYHQWIANPKQAEDSLVIYTAGFPHRTLQHMLTKLSTFLRNNDGSTDIYHWGDIDVGGIRIFEYIRKHFLFSLQPINMDMDTFIANVGNGTPLSPSYIKKVTDMLGQPQFSEWHSILCLIEKHRVRIEQESIVW